MTARSAVAKLLGLAATAARHDPALFNAFVLRDEATGLPIQLAPHHTAMLHTWDTCDRSVTWAHVDAGKTTNLLGYVVRELGRDPTQAIGYVSCTAIQGEKFLRAVAAIIENSSELHQVFPNLKPGNVWRQDALTVAAAPSNLRDPNLQRISPIRAPCSAHA